MVSSWNIYSAPYFETPTKLLLGVRNLETEGFSDNRIPSRAKLLSEIVGNLTGTLLIVSGAGRLQQEQEDSPGVWGGEAYCLPYLPQPTSRRPKSQSPASPWTEIIKLSEDQNSLFSRI